ncbi:stalk domain-containing protein [Thermoanaerobacter thermohydrosulfuricus]
MIKSKTAIVFSILLLIFGFVMGFAYAQSNSIKIVVDGNTIATDVPPFIKDGRTFVPIRAISEALGVPVKWDGATSTVYIGTVPGGLDLVDDLKPFVSGASLLEDNPVSITGVKYNHGYYSSFPIDLRWNLGGKYKTLTFSTGIPDDALGFTYISIYGDGQLLKDINNLFDGIKDYTIDITGVKILRIIGNGRPIINPRVQ